MPEAPFPQFRTPPVNEVVYGVSLRAPRLALVSLFEFWESSIRQDLPSVEERPPYAPALEVLDRAPIGPRLNLHLGEGAPSPRLWLTDSSGDVVVQLQSDWFATNVRRTGPDSPYRGYPRTRAVFADYFQAFTSFISERGLGDVRVQQCELTYVNRIEPDDRVWTSHGELHKVLTLAGHSHGQFLDQIESIQVNATSIISDSTSVPLGRLHISARPSVSSDDLTRPLLTLTLTARGFPRSEEPSSVLEFFDIGHEWIVKSFADITTKSMQEIVWGRHE